MSAVEIAALALLIVAICICAVLALRLLYIRPIQHRLDAQIQTTTTAQSSALPTGTLASSWVARIIRLSGPLAKLSLPDEEWESSRIRIRFMHAGLRHRSAPTVFFTAKTMLALVLPLITSFMLLSSGTDYSANGLLIMLLLAASIGNYLPNVILNKMIAKRQRDIFENFPDALDLMTVCVEAGLAIDAALARVANEIGLRSAVLSDELLLVTLELGAGNSKEKALRNLALRTGIEDVESLVAMLIQSERFGTSIAASLRVQSEQLRTKRRQQAEEQAAKIALKLLFPLIFFIFPCLLVVIMGPAFLQIYRVMLPALAGNN
jgi:tight adherence protein C